MQFWFCLFCTCCRKTAFCFKVLSPTSLRFLVTVYWRNHPPKLLIYWCFSRFPSFFLSRLTSPFFFSSTFCSFFSSFFFTRIEAVHKDSFYFRVHVLIYYYCLKESWSEKCWHGIFGSKAARFRKEVEIDNYEWTINTKG